ncbi:hypothetical protein ACFWY5_51005 [Nonomuraea sp. NPDC059007]
MIAERLASSRPRRFLATRSCSRTTAILASSPRAACASATMAASELTP